MLHHGGLRSWAEWGMLPTSVPGRWLVTRVPLPCGPVHGEGSLRLQSTAGGRAVVLQAGHHPQRRQAGRRLVRAVGWPRVDIAVGGRWRGHPGFSRGSSRGGF